MSLLKNLSAVVLSFSALTAIASPSYLTTHNNTSEESNAYIAGIPSLYPTPAHSTKQVYWNLVKLACFGHTTNGKCSAVIKMATNTSNPIEIAQVSMDLNSGVMTIDAVKNNDYEFIINAPGEATIIKKEDHS